MDGVCVCSSQDSVMNQSFLYIEDVKPGMDVSGEVVSIESYGILIKLTSVLKALIPTVHASDVILSDLHKKYKIGQTVKARVLHVDAKTKRITLTAKKNFVKSYHTCCYLLL